MKTELTVEKMTELELLFNQILWPDLKYDPDGSPERNLRNGLPKIIAAVLDAQPKPTGGLSDEDAGLIAYNAYKNAAPGLLIDALRTAALAVRDACQSAQGPGYFKTAERKPTQEDGDSSGLLLSWGGKGPWLSVYWADVAQYPQNHPYWMKQPPAPVSEEDDNEKAFSDFLKSEKGYVYFGNEGEMGKHAAREAWDAALKHAAEKEAK